MRFSPRRWFKVQRHTAPSLRCFVKSDEHSRPHFVSDDPVFGDAGSCGCADAGCSVCGCCCGAEPKLPYGIDRVSSGPVLCQLSRTTHMLTTFAPADGLQPGSGSYMMPAGRRYVRCRNF